MLDRDNQKGTDRDVRPTQGQESNENWDDSTEQQSSDTNADKKKTNAVQIDEETHTSGAGSSQRASRDNNVGPLQSDLAELPSQKRREGLTGSGID